VTLAVSVIISLDVTKEESSVRVLIVYQVTRT
jgi:hypothetical protein